MKYIIISIMILLTGCCTPPSRSQFPDMPISLQSACASLIDVPADTTKLSELLQVVSTNYAEYYQCKLKVDAWLDWHKEQKKIFDDVQKVQ